MGKTTVHPVVFNIPPQLRLDAGPSFDVTGTTSANGHGHDNLDWEFPLWSYKFQFRRYTTGFRDIQGFFLARRSVFGFFFLDPTDYRDEGFGEVRQVDGIYRLVKTYPDIDAHAPFSRIITRPVEGTVNLAGVPGDTPTIDYTTGIVSGATGTGSATFEFHVPVKFTMRACIPTYAPISEEEQLADWMDIDLLELREYEIAE